MLQNKCVQYWPNDDERSKTFDVFQGSITVTLNDTVSNSDFIKRTLTVDQKIDKVDFYFDLVSLFWGTFYGIPKVKVNQSSQGLAICLAAESFAGVFHILAVMMCMPNGLMSKLWWISQHS